MLKMKVYDVYLDDGHNAIKVTVPAVSKKAAADYVRGNGDIVAIRDCPLQDINIDCLAETLARNLWGQMEIDVITRALTQCGLRRI